MKITGRGIRTNDTIRVPLFPFSLLLLLVVLLPRPTGAASGDQDFLPGNDISSASAAPVNPVDSEEYLAELLAAADRMKLYEDRYWHVLLHYKRGIFGLRSLVDDPQFFADPNGKHDPRAELLATIRSFFQPPVEDGRLHPVCRFVARYEWLGEVLAIDETRLPVPRCDAFEELIAGIRPVSATLIFPTSHMNSPASMYGHTLLTIETESKSKLLSYAINYSALTSNRTIAPVYMAKGLFGGYPGYFSILPYYAKLQEYSDVNDRDIWEYPLDLDAEEVRRLITHVYELDNVYSNYFFFKENCSYDLLFLLEAARPSLDLTDRFRWWVIPLDTIRAVKESGLIGDAIYRPSKSTKVAYLSDLVTGEQRNTAWGLVRGTSEPAAVLAGEDSDEEKIQVLDLASEYLQYVYTKGDLPKDLYLPRFLATLSARSTLGDAGEWRYTIPPPERPDEGHHSNRLAVGVGTEDEVVFQEIRLRPAYHALLDNPPGFKTGSQIVFVDTALRYYPRESKARLEAIDLIDIVSIAPRQQFFRPISWKVKTGFFRRRAQAGRLAMVWGLNPAFGVAYDTKVPGLSYLLLETDLHVGSALSGSYSLGGGVSAGVITDLTGWWKAHLTVRYLDYPLGDETSALTLGLGQSFRISTDLGLSVVAERKTFDDDDPNLETMVSGSLFF